MRSGLLPEMTCLQEIHLAASILDRIVPFCSQNLLFLTCSSSQEAFVLNGHTIVSSETNLWSCLSTLAPFLVLVDFVPLFFMFCVFNLWTTTNHCLHVVCALGRHARELPAGSLELRTDPGLQPAGGGAQHYHHAHLPLHCSHRRPSCSTASACCCW